MGPPLGGVLGFPEWRPSLSDRIEDKLDAMPPRRLLMVKGVAVVLWTVFCGWWAWEIWPFDSIFGGVGFGTMYVFVVALISGNDDLADRIWYGGEEPKEWDDKP